eukprot:s872_g17.t1
MLSTVLEEMGKRSAAAQGLRKPVTSGAFLGDQRVYLLAQGKTALGVLKVGRKRLFVEAPFRSCELADVRNSFQEIEPLCTLDFYVHEKCQRSGFGHQLFSTMLQLEEIAPEQMGYDRPTSPKTTTSWFSMPFGTMSSSRIFEGVLGTHQQLAGRAQATGSTRREEAASQVKERMSFLPDRPWTISGIAERFRLRRSSSIRRTGEVETARASSCAFDL